MTAVSSNQAQPTYTALYTLFDKDPAPIADFIAWAAGHPPQARLLDAGCGPGRLLHTLGARGWDVVGLEPDAAFCQAAQAKAGAHPRMRVCQGRFSDIPPQSAFDVVAAVNDPLAYLLSVEERRAALEAIWRALRPGGLLVLEIKNFLHKLLHYADTHTHEEHALWQGRAVLHHTRHELDLHNARWIHHDEYFVEGCPEPITRTHELAIITWPELRYLLRAVGFRAPQTYHDYADRAPRPADGRHLLVTARKRAP